MKRLKRFLNWFLPNYGRATFEFKDLADQHDFEVWAFGHTPVKYGVASMHSWNSRHGHIYFVKSDELIDHSVQKMYKIYKDHQH